MSKTPPCRVDGFAWLQGMGTNATGGYRFPEYWRRKPVLHERLGQKVLQGWPPNDAPQVGFKAGLDVSPMEEPDAADHGSHIKRRRSKSRAERLGAVKRAIKMLKGI